jgi:toxin ParE1/3/4
MQEFRLSTKAESDLTNIWAYRAESGEERADELIDRLVKQFIMLATFREAGRSRPELGKNIRSFAIEQHVVFYQIIDTGIEIVRVLHGSRDIKKVFDENVD